jgi:hypothetical protein
MKTIAQKAPKKVLISLADVTIRRVEDFSGKSWAKALHESMSVSKLALGLDFIERIGWRRTAEEKETWLDTEAVADRLHALRGLVRLRQELVERDELAVSEEGWDAFIADVLEYFTIRAELAGETHIPRERRYMVTVDAPALAVAPKRKAVA